MHRVDDVDSECRCGTDEEDDDDRKGNGREVLLLALPHLQRAPHPPASSQGEDQLPVEEDEEGKREKKEEEGVEGAGVEVAIHCAVSQ